MVRIPLGRPLRLGLCFLLAFAVHGAGAQDEPGPVPGAEDEAPAVRPVDLELILAVDSSSSVSEQEFDLQMRGIAEAFRSPAVAAAIRAIGDLGVAVSLVQWSDNRSQFLSIDWQLVDSAESAFAFSEEVDKTPRFLVGGGTAIGGALSYASRQFERNQFEGVRRVIDISGDGRTNQGIQPAQIRDAVVAQGIVINGLAILNEDVFIDRYYRFHVIGGTGAFVMTAANYEDFGDAILLKLIKEIAGTPVAGLPGVPGPLLSDAGAAEQAE